MEKTKLQMLLEGSKGTYKGNEIVFIKELPFVPDYETIIVIYKNDFGNYYSNIVTPHKLEELTEITFNQKRTIGDGLIEGDIIVSKARDERYVLGVSGKVIFLSYNRAFNSVSHHATLTDLIKNGYKLKQEIETETLTMEQVCKELGREVKIKK